MKKLAIFCPRPAAVHEAAKIPKKGHFIHELRQTLVDVIFVWEFDSSVNYNNICGWVYLFPTTTILHARKL